MRADDRDAEAVGDCLDALIKRGRLLRRHKRLALQIWFVDGKDATWLMRAQVCSQTLHVVRVTPSHRQELHSCFCRRVLSIGEMPVVPPGDRWGQSHKVLS